MVSWAFLFSILYHYAVKLMLATFFLPRLTALLLIYSILNLNLHKCISLIINLELANIKYAFLILWLYSAIIRFLSWSCCSHYAEWLFCVFILCVCSVLTFPVCIWCLQYKTSLYHKIGITVCNSWTNRAFI